MRKFEIIEKIAKARSTGHTFVGLDELREIFGSETPDNERCKCTSHCGVNKTALIKKIIDDSWGDGLPFSFVKTCYEKLLDDSDRRCSGLITTDKTRCCNADIWTFHHANGDSYKFCPNCGIKFQLSGYEEPCACNKEPEICSNKYCKCTTPKLIRRIHCEKNHIRFTHSNDLDTLTTMEHREVQQFTDSSNRDGSFIKRLRCMNLADELTLYNCELPYLDGYYDKDDMKGVMMFGCFLNALSVLGYRMHAENGYDKGYGDFHIVELKKENKKKEGSCYSLK